MVIIADRSFRDRSATDLVPFFKTVGKNISTKPEFLAFKTLGENLLTENLDLEKYNEAVLAKDLRERGNRKTAKGNCVKITNNICNEINAIANNDPAVYSAAGLEYVEVASAGRPIGETKVESVKFNSLTGRIAIRVRKADRAKGYRIDLKTPTGEILIEYATIADTKGSFPAPSKPGAYRCCAVPIDSKQILGNPSAWSEDFGVY